MKTLVAFLIFASFTEASGGVLKSCLVRWGLLSGGVSAKELGIPRGALGLWVTMEYNFHSKTKQPSFAVRFRGDRLDTQTVSAEEVRAWIEAGYLDPENAKVMGTNAGEPGGVVVPVLQKPRILEDPRAALQKMRSILSGSDRQVPALE